MNPAFLLFLVRLMMQAATEEVTRETQDEKLPFGITTDVRDLHPGKAQPSMDVTPSGGTTDVRELQH
jgi:hypothetical protein